MTKRSNYTLIGFFLIGAFALLFAGIISIAGGNWFSKPDLYVIFFSGSIKGLSVGSPVNLKGARIGSVKEIRVVMYQDDLSVRVPVIVEIDPDAIALGTLGKKSKPMPGDVEERLGFLVHHGLRAKLGIESIVTGQLNVTLDFFPSTSIVKVGREPQYPEIPSLPSAFEELSKTFENLPLQNIAQTLEHTLLGLDKVVNSPDFLETIKQIGVFSKSSADLAQALTQQLPALLEDARGLLRNSKDLPQELQKTLVDLQRTIVSLQSIASDQGPFGRQFSDTLNNVSAAAQSLENFADYLDRHPESLLRGKEAD